MARSKEDLSLQRSPSAVQIDDASRGDMRGISSDIKPRHRITARGQAKGDGFRTGQRGRATRQRERTQRRGFIDGNGWFWGQLLSRKVRGEGADAAGQSFRDVLYEAQRASAFAAVARLHHFCILTKEPPTVAR